ITNQSGAVTDRFASDAWGAQVKRTGTSVNRHWYIGNRGYARSADQPMDYVRARQLMVTRARWLSRDPIVVASDPNLYSYAAGRPTAAADPSGLQISRKYGPVVKWTGHDEDRPCVGDPCWAISWRIQWDIEAAARNTTVSGWIIQEVELGAE